MPEEVDGAGLAAEPAAELLEDTVRPVENAAVALDRVAIPGRVLAIVRERSRDWQSERLLLDLDVDAELVEDLMKARIEVGDGDAVGQVERAGAAVVGANEQRVVDEVEVDLECRVLVVEPPRRQAAHVDVERCVPPVVPRCCGRESDLADDLAVQMERVLSRAPVGQMQFRQRHRLDHWGIVADCHEVAWARGSRSDAITSTGMDAALAVIEYRPSQFARSFGRSWLFRIPRVSATPRPFS